MIEITIAIISLIIGFLLGYYKSYYNEKGKNKALIQDIRQLTEEKEKVTSTYDLENSKRKYKYEHKSNLYFKYFSLLDELSATSNEDAQNEFMPAMNRFTNRFLNANDNQIEQNNATAEFAESINNLMHKSQKSFIKFKNETTSIKLIAGNNVLTIMEDIENASNEVFDYSSNMMKEFGSNIISQNTEILERQKIELEVLGKRILNLKENLTQEIRKELNEI